MKRILTLLCTCVLTMPALACTSMIVGKKASADGSVLSTYSADSYGSFEGLIHFPAVKHESGTMRKIYDGDTNEYHGEIPEASETYNVVGNINEWQVTIGETTFGGRHEMVDPTGIMDYVSLMKVGLQRSKTAREAISVMTTIAETYGYNSEGETFTICDPNEAWIMEMMGCGPNSKGVVWVALRVPDDVICAHANQSRIRTFNQKDKENVICSKNVVKFAREKGWFDGKDEEFSFCDTYAAPDFGGRRWCEARVWSFYNRFSDGMERYIPFVEGKVKDAEPMPLWIKPNRKVSLQDLENAMRDHYEGTPFALDGDIGGGIWEMPYRPTPLQYEVDGKQYFNERPISTQQAQFVYVTQMRSWLPREIGGIIWFANDDGNMVPFTPVYCSSTRSPHCYDAQATKADALNFSMDNAYWVCNWVSNMVYPRYSLMFPALKQVRDSLDTSYAMQQPSIEAEALRLHKINPRMAVDYLTEYGDRQGDNMIQRWQRLAFYLIVKYNDMIIKPEEAGSLKRSPFGLGATVKRPGYPQKYARELIKGTGDKFLIEEK